MSAFTVVGLGELLWDFLPTGSLLGGAPCNVAFHANALGDRGVIVSRVGADALGETALKLLGRSGVDVSHVQRDSVAPTGTVSVSLDKRRQPTFTITTDVAWDRMEWTDEWLGVARKADAVCFGTLAQRTAQSCATIGSFIDALKPECLTVFDVNLRQFFYSPDIIRSSLSRANACKMNEQELPTVASALGIPVSNTIETARRIVDAFELRLLAVTRGSRGSVIVAADETVEHPGFRVTVQDTVGAGDAFVAGVIHGVLHGMSFADTIHVASERGAWVAMHSGAMPDPASFDRRAFM
jgi:fructokinase